MSKNEAQRASNKRSIIRMAKTVNGFTNDTSLVDLETNLDMLDDYWVQFQAVQVAIEATTGAQEIEIQVIEMIDTERIYQTTKSKVKGFIKRYADQDRQQNRHGQGDSNPQANLNPQQNNSSRSSRLPKLDVPQFDGTYVAWTTFKDLFKSMVTDQPGLTDARKLQYLTISCNSKNEAADIVSEYQITDANFAPAWAALENRFENRRLIINSHLKLLFEQPSMTTESSTSLRLLLRTTQRCLRSLKSLGGPTEHWDWLLIHMIVVRLDSKTRRYWELTHTTKEMATFDQLVNALENRCNALEMEISSAAVQNAESKSSPFDKMMFQQSTKDLSSTISSSTCPICCGTHVPAKCKEFLAKNYDGRTELVSMYGLCFKCLNPNHNFRSCDSECRKCGKKHHVLMHNPNFDKKAEPPLNTVPVTPIQNHILVSNTKSIIGAKRLFTQSQVLLSTALVKIRTGRGHWVLVRAFLDSGSQSCVVTQRCVQRFNLQISSCNVPVTGIGEVNAGTFEKEANVQIVSRLDSSIQLDINAVVMESISTNLPNKRFDISDWSYIEGLQLADPEFNEPGPIDILIGAEHYLSLLLNEEKKQGPDGHPCAINTVFGWILSGNVTSSEESNSSKIFSIVTEMDFVRVQVAQTFCEVKRFYNPTKSSLWKTRNVKNNLKRLIIKTKKVVSSLVFCLSKKRKKLNNRKFCVLP